MHHNTVKWSNELFLIIYIYDKQSRGKEDGKRSEKHTIYKREKKIWWSAAGNIEMYLLDADSFLLKFDNVVVVFVAVWK